jgi:tRNA (cmo5U34)-methyltransferase
MSQPSSDFFGDRAEAYDGFIARLVPDYHEANVLMMDLVPFAADAPIRVLDVGTGTGALAAEVLRRFVKAEITVTDMSERMLAQCKARFRALGASVECIEGVFPETDIGGGYDLVVSSLALHHLSHDDKRAGFAKLYAAMNPGGVLLVRDVVAGATPAIDARYAALWRATVQAHGHDDMSWFDDHLVDDNPATVEDQTAWLADIGFIEVGCHWRHLGCALFGGQKSAPEISRGLTRA